jgi:hypothetical protein
VFFCVPWSCVCKCGAPSSVCFVPGYTTAPVVPHPGRLIVQQFRVLRLVFGSSVSLKQWARVACQGLPPDPAAPVPPDSGVWPEELDFMRAASDRFFDVPVMATFLGTAKKALERGARGEPVVVAATEPLPQTLAAVRDIAMECAQHVVDRGANCGWDVPFEWFLGAHRLCQFARQSARVEMWRHAISGTIPAPVAIPYDVQTSKALSCFTSSEVHVGHAYLNIAVEPARLRLSQSVAQRELDWAGMVTDPTYPGSWEFLCRLGFCSNQPFRVFASVSPSVLFEMLSGIPEAKSEDPVVSAVIERLLDELEDPFFSGQLAVRDVVRAQYGTLLAVLRWCLCQTDQGRARGDRVALQDTDFQVLTEMGLSVELTDRKTATLFPKIRRLGDDTGMDGFLLCDPGIKNALVRSPLLADLFPRGGVAGAGQSSLLGQPGAGSTAVGDQGLQGGSPVSGTLDALSVGATLLEFVLDVPEVDLEGSVDGAPVGLLGAPFVQHARLLSAGDFKVSDDRTPDRGVPSSAYLDTSERWLEQLAVVFGSEDWRAIAASFVMLDASAVVLLATRARTKAVADWVAVAALHVATNVLDAASQRRYVVAMVECGLTRQLKQRNVGTQFLNFFGRLLGRNIRGEDSCLRADTHAAVQGAAGNMLRATDSPNIRFHEMALSIIAASSWTLEPLRAVAPLTCLSSADVVCELLFEVFWDGSVAAASGPAMLTMVLEWVPLQAIQYLSRLLRRRMAAKAIAKQPFTCMKLVGLCWAMFPYDDLVPTVELFAFIKSVIEPEGAVRRSFFSAVAKYPFAVARLAMFIAHPERLDPLTYKSFANQVGDNRMKEDVFLIGQETDNWVPYTLRVYKVRLSGMASLVTSTCRALRTSGDPLVSSLAAVGLLRKLWTRPATADAGNPLRGDKMQDINKVLELDVSSGVSEDTLVRNACSLLFAALHSAPEGAPKRLGNWNVDFVPTWRYVFNVASSWFASFGCSDEDVLRLLHAVLDLSYPVGAGVEAVLAERYRAAIVDAEGVSANRAGLTYVPFQSYIDIRWRDPLTDRMVMFGGSHDCLSFTLQVVGAVLPPLENVQPFPDLLLSRPVVDDGAFLLESTSVQEKIGVLVRMVRPYCRHLGQVVARIAMSDPLKANHWKTVSNKAAELLGPFVSLLHLLMRSVAVAVVCDPSPMQLLSWSIRSFADGIRQATMGASFAGEVSRLTQGLLHRRVFELVGVSNCKSTNRLHRALLESWIRAPAMKLCHNSFKELWYWEYAELHISGLVELGLATADDSARYVNEQATVDVKAVIGIAVDAPCLHVGRVVNPSFPWTDFHGGGHGVPGAGVVVAEGPGGGGGGGGDVDGVLQLDGGVVGDVAGTSTFFRARPSVSATHGENGEGGEGANGVVIPRFNPVGLDLPSLVVTAGLLSVVSHDGVCEVRVVGSGSYSLMRVNGESAKADNTIASAMHVLCCNALVGSVEEVLVKRLSVSPWAARRLVQAGRVSFCAAFESPESAWAYFSSCPDVTLLVPEYGLALRHKGVDSTVWTPFVNSREVFDGKVGAQGVPPVPPGFPKDFLWGKYCFNTVDLARAVRCLHIDTHQAQLRSVLHACAMVAYDHWLNKPVHGEESVSFARAVFGDPAHVATAQRLCTMQLFNNLGQVETLQPYQGWLACLRLPMYWRIAKDVADTTAGVLEVLASVSRLKLSSVEEVLQVPEHATLTSAFASENVGGLVKLLRDAQRCESSLLSALASFLGALQAGDVSPGDVDAAVDKEGSDSSTYLDQWTAKLAALRCVLLSPFMTASRDRVLTGVLSTVRSLHERDWMKGGFDRALFTALSGESDLEHAARTMSSVLTRQPGPMVCERLQSLCGMDVSAVLALQVSGDEVYSDAVVGRPVVFCVHESVLQGALNTETKAWVSYVLRSPLCPFLRRAIVKLAQCPGTVFDPLECVVSPDRPGPLVDVDLQPAAKLSAVDQVCVFHALALRCPLTSTQTSMRQLVAPYLTPTLEDLLMRKSNNIYGMRVIPGLYGVHMMLADMGVTCEVRELEASYQVGATVVSVDFISCVPCEVRVACQLGTLRSRGVLSCTAFCQMSLLEQAKSETDDVIYSGIRLRQQATQTCFVYLRGMPTISNGREHVGSSG